MLQEHLFKLAQWTKKKGGKALGVYTHVPDSQQISFLDVDVHVVTFYNLIKGDKSESVILI